MYQAFPIKTRITFEQSVVRVDGYAISQGDHPVRVDGIKIPRALVEEEFERIYSPEDFFLSSPASVKRDAVYNVLQAFEDIGMLQFLRSTK